MSEKRVLIQRHPCEHGGVVAQVILNRPDKRNGLDLAMFDAVVAAAAELAEAGDVRCVVINGAGPSFCAGLDFQSVMASPEGIQRLLREKVGDANLAQAIAWVWHELPMPVIAAVHGHCIGGGLQIALAADIRIVAPDTKLSVMEIDYGLIPDMSASKTLLRLVRPDIAKELTFTGRVFSGEEAVALGVATRTSDTPLEDSLALAHAIAARNPHAIRGTKALFDRAPELSVADSLALEAELQTPLLGSPNQLEALKAKMGKRPAVFSDD